MFYIDTSVLAAYYCPEKNSNKVEKIMTVAKRLCISHLTEVELASALSRKIRERKLEKVQASQILAIFSSHIQQGIYLWQAIEYQHYQLAKAWIEQFSLPLRTLDALHLAIAATNQLNLLTADKQLMQSASLLNIKVTLIE